MEKADHLLQLVNRVLDDHLDQHGEPQRVELTHVVTECRQESHELAHFCLHRFVLYFVVNLIVRKTQVLDVELLKERVDLVCRLQEQNYEEKSTHIAPTAFFKGCLIPGLRVSKLEGDREYGEEEVDEGGDCDEVVEPGVHLQVHIFPIVVVLLNSHLINVNCPFWNE